MRARVVRRAAALLAVFSTCLAAAHAADIAFESISIGFENEYRVGSWTPVVITLTGGDVPTTGYVEVIVPDGDDVPSLVRGRDIQLVPNQSTSTTLFVRFGRVESSLTARFVSEGSILVSKTWRSGIDHEGDFLPIGLDADERLFLQIGPSVGLEQVFRSQDPGAANGGGTVVASLSDTGNLPTRWYSYEGIEAVVLSTSRPETIRALTAAQLEALDEWVRMGGRLIVCAGSGAHEFLTANGPLARFVPGEMLDPVTPLSTLSAFEKLAETTTPIAETVGQQEELAARPLSVPRLKVTTGRVEAAELDLPLVIRAPHGFGQVVFVAADLDRDPFRRWRGLPQLLAKLLGADAPVAVPGGEFAPLAHNEGYRDLAGQLRSSLDQFQGIRLVPFSVVALMIVAYILLIGPGDYFFLKKVLGRMELTWITFPTIVVLTSLAAYALGRYFKGDEVRINQADVVDFDFESGRVRGTSFMNVFSPRMDTYHFTYQPAATNVDPAPIRPLVGWLGLPGNGLGGMSNDGTSAGIWSRPYRFSEDLDAMEEVPIVVMGTKSVTARWEASAPSPVGGELRDAGAGTVVGSIENRSDQPLEDAFLLYGRWAYDFGTLAPGQRRELTELGEKRRDLRRYLSGERTEQTGVDSSYTAREAYDLSSQSADRVLRQMLFFEAAGGERYAGLVFRYQQFLDASPLLAAGRAVLVARPSASQSRWRNGARELSGPRDGRWTYYRVVLPVSND